MSKAGVKAFTEALQHELRNTPDCKVTAHLLIPGFVFTALTRGDRTEKPDAAWTSAQTVDFMLESLERGDFYILCPDNDVPRALDERRMAWAIGDIIEIATTLPGFDTLATLVTQGKLIDTLKSEGPFTVFAPTNDAFAKLPAAVVDAVTGDPTILDTVLKYHVISGKYNLDQLPEGKIKTVAGVELTVTKVDGVTYIDGNAVVVQNVQAKNGVIHVLGNVLVPPLGDIIDVATTLPGFDTLAGLVTSAGLIDTLKSDGPFTVFAPTDDAFKALDAATLAAVQADPKLLDTVLKYHVISGKLTTDQLKEGKIMTVAGVELTVTKKDGVTYIDGNPIVVQNVQATNGVIQVMGAVLVPAS